jgi:hypothetical protein
VAGVSSGKPVGGVQDSRACEGLVALMLQGQTDTTSWLIPRDRSAAGLALYKGPNARPIRDEDGFLAENIRDLTTLHDCSSTPA